MNDEGVWVTIKGRRVFIKNGWTLSTAIKKHEEKDEKLTTKEKLTALKRTLTDSENSLLSEHYFLHGNELKERLISEKERAQAFLDDHKEIDTKNPSGWLEKMNVEKANIDVDKLVNIDKLHNDILVEAKEKVADYAGKMSELNGIPVYQKENGEIISMLSTKDYKKMATEFANTLTDDEKDIICSYVASPAYAYSSELNANSDTALEQALKNNSGGLTRYALNLNENNICTERERNELRVKAYNDYLERCKEKGVDRLSYDDIGAWKKDHGLGYNQDPWTISDTKVYTDKQIHEAREIATKLEKIENERMRVSAEKGYDSKEYIELSQKHEELQTNIDQALNDGKKYSAYYYKSIADSDTNIVFKDNLGNGTIDDSAKEGILYMNTKQMLDMTLTPEQLKIQPTSIQRSYKGIHSATKEFDNLFKEKGVELKEDLLVFRRGREDRNEIENGFTMHGYVSTSAFDKLPKKMPSGNHFGEVSYYLLIPKGSRILFAEKVIGYNDKTDEDRAISRGVQRQHEIILPRETSFSKITYDSSRQAYVLLTEQHLFGEGGKNNE